METTTRSRRSKGCLGCRKSKVKCSEDQPRCTRCTRQGTDCHYPDPLEIDFRSENSKAAVRAVTLWRQRAAATAAATPLHEQPRPPGDDLQHRALAAFYRDFGCTAEVANPWLEFFQMLPSLYRQAAGNPASAQAIRALALAHHARQQQTIPQLEILARTEYSKTLRLIRSQLENRRDGVPGTDVIVSVSLMGLFETILPSSSSGAWAHPQHAQHQAQSWQAHQHGAISMIQQQTQAAPDGAAPEAAVDPRLLKFMYLLMIVSCLNARTRPQLPLHLWTGVLGPRLPAAKLFRVMYNLAQWQADIDSYLAEEPEPASWSTDHLTRSPMEEMAWMLVQADNALQEWESRLPAAFQFYERQAGPRDHEMLQWPGAPRRVYVYESCWRAIPRTFCFAVRILLAQNLLRCSRWIAERDPAHGDWPRHPVGPLETIEEMVGHIARSTIAIVGTPEGSVANGRGAGEGEAMRGLAIVWPLSIAATALQRNPALLSRVGVDRARWVENALLYVRRLVGNCKYEE